MLARRLLASRHQISGKAILSWTARLRYCRQAHQQPLPLRCVLTLSDVLTASCALAVCGYTATFLPHTCTASCDLANDDTKSFIASATFQGVRKGYVFTTRQDGTGYYLEGTTVDSRGLDSQRKLPKKESSEKAAAGYEMTGSGLQYRDVRVGEGPHPQIGHTIKVHYVGRLYSNRVLGQKFDSSYDRGVPLTFPIGNGTGKVIRGWEEGVLGSKLRLDYACPYDQHT
jgi:hypothetical protein